MSALLPMLVSWLQEYGYPVLWLSVFVAAVGVPLPTTLVLLATGAFAALGDFSIVLLVLVTVTASTAGDNVGYFIGRSWGSKVLEWLEKPRRRNLISPRTIVRARLYFKRRGGWAIFLSRFLVSALGGVTNLLAGSDLYPYRRFLVYDISGEVLGAAIPLLLGYIFGASWETVGDLLGYFSLFVLGVIVVIFLTVRLVKLETERGQTSRVSSTNAVTGAQQHTVDAATRGTSGPLLL